MYYCTSMWLSCTVHLKGVLSYKLFEEITLHSRLASDEDSTHVHVMMWYDTNVSP